MLPPASLVICRLAVSFCTALKRYRRIPAFDRAGGVDDVMGGASFNKEGVHDAEAYDLNTSTRKMRKKRSVKPTYGVPGEDEARVRQHYLECRGARAAPPYLPCRLFSERDSHESP